MIHEKRHLSGMDWMDAYGLPGVVRYNTITYMLLSGSMMSKPEVLLKEEEEELSPVEEERSC